MAGLTCVYLHGFLSSGKSQKGQWVAAQVKSESALNNQSKPTDIQMVVTPTYPIVSPVASVKAIESILQPFKTTNPEHALQHVILIGSSMGGFYAQYFGQKYQIPYVMINPALKPVEILSAEKGRHQNPNTGELFTIDDLYLQQLAVYDVVSLNVDIPALLLVDELDEVIDIGFAMSRYQTVGGLFQAKRYMGGNHAFQHIDQAWSDIKSFIENNAEKFN